MTGALATATPRNRKLFQSQIQMKLNFAWDHPWLYACLWRSNTLLLYLLNILYKIREDGCVHTITLYSSHHCLLLVRINWICTLNLCFILWNISILDTQPEYQIFVSCEHYSRRMSFNIVFLQHTSFSHFLLQNNVSFLFCQFAGSIFEIISFSFLSSLAIQGR